MNKKTPKKDITVIKSDKYISESGTQGGKILGEHLTLGCFIIGIPFFIIGLIAFFSILVGLGFPNNTANIIAALLVTVIGLLLIIGGYFNYKDKYVKK